MKLTGFHEYSGTYAASFSISNFPVFLPFNLDEKHKDCVTSVRSLQDAISSVKGEQNATWAKEDLGK